MDRNESILIITENKIKNLSREKREELILNWWGIDNEDLEFKLLSKTLQQELSKSDEPLDDVMEKKYNPLLRIAIKDEFLGVRNEYLSEIVSKILCRKVIVEGKIESLKECPCCKYKTLTERGQYEICPVCFWEDDGSNEPTRYSSPNHMTLNEGRERFIKFKDSREDMKKRYIKS